MVVSVTNLTKDGLSTGSVTYTTATITGTPNTIIIASVGGDDGGAAAGTTTASGMGLTWTQVTTKVTPGTQRRITMFRAVCKSQITGEITFTWSDAPGNGCNWVVDKFLYIDTDGLNGSNSIVQSASNSSDSATNLTVTLGAFSNTNNATYGVIFKNGSEVISQGSGFTEVAESNVTSGRSIQSEFKSTNDTTADWSWSTNHAITAIAVELKYSESGGAGFFAML